MSGGGARRLVSLLRSGLRLVCALAVTATGCNYIFGVDPQPPKLLDASGADSGTDTSEAVTFCAMQSGTKFCADFDSLATGLINFTTLGNGAGQAQVAPGGQSPPNRLAIDLPASTGGATDDIRTRASYTETGFNGVIRFSVKATTPTCNARIATITWPPTGYTVYVDQRTTGFGFALAGTACAVATMMTATSLDLAQWHSVEIHAEVSAGTAAVVVDGEFHAFTCNPGFAGNTGMMQTDIGAVVASPHAACGVAFDDVMIR